jgi:hypothetical protein
VSGFLFTFPTPPAEAPVAPVQGQLFQSPRPAGVRTPNDFREFVKRLSPAWLSYMMGERLVGYIGLVWDTLAEGAMLAVTARSMLSRTFPTDAIYLIGSERNLQRYPGEELDAYADRLWRAWRLWEQAGSDIGLIQQFAIYGATCEIVRNDEWNWDGDAEASRVWCVLTEHGFVRDSTCGDGKICGGGQTCGSSASEEQVRAARKLVRTFKPAHMRVEKIVVIVDDALPFEEPDGTWDQPENRSPQAIYWPG